MVCAIGLSADSERVLRLASGAAANVHSKLSIIHVIHGATPAGGNVRRQLDELQKTVGCEAAVLIAKSPVKDALLDAAGSSDADVLIVGRTPRPGALGGLGILHIPSFGTRLVRC
jgi:K+-sensing histidine kinase KdpD